MLYTDTIISFMVLFEFLSCWWYGVFKNLSTAMQLGFIKWILLQYEKSVEDVDHFVCMYSIYVYISNGSKYCKSHLVCILAQNICMHFIVLGFWGGLKSEI